MHSENEESPRSNLSHKWKILWSGNTSTIKQGVLKTISYICIYVTVNLRENIVKNQGMA